MNCSTSNFIAAVGGGALHGQLGMGGTASDNSVSWHTSCNFMAHKLQCMYCSAAAISWAPGSEHNVQGARPSASLHVSCTAWAATEAWPGEGIHQQARHARCGSPRTGSNGGWGRQGQVLRWPPLGCSAALRSLAWPLPCRAACVRLPPQMPLQQSARRLPRRLPGSECAPARRCGCCFSRGRALGPLEPVGPLGWARPAPLRRQEAECLLSWVRTSSPPTARQAVLVHMHTVQALCQGPLSFHSIGR